jgi:hypothetical protein
MISAVSTVIHPLETPQLRLISFFAMRFNSKILVRTHFKNFTPCLSQGPSDRYQG